MRKVDIVFDGFHLGSWEDDFNSEEAIICFERLVDNPCMMLANKYKIKSKVEYMSLILPHISKLFNIDRSKLRERWVRDSYYYDCFGEKNAKNSYK